MALTLEEIEKKLDEQSKKIEEFCAEFASSKNPTEYKEKVDKLQAEFKNLLIAHQELREKLQKPEEHHCFWCA